MKKIYFLILILLVAVVASGCAKNKEKLAEEMKTKGSFYFNNDDLNFSLYLPRSFLYFNTVREDADDYSEVRFYVPITDVSSYSDLSGYGQPLTVRIFKKKAWNKLKGVEKKKYKKLGEKKENVYAMSFWEKIPSDWSVKWTDDLKKEIIDNFEIK